MIRPINHDPTFLAQPARSATNADLNIATDLVDTLRAHQQNCLGMAANMIGQNVAIIAIYLGQLPVVMINPQLLAKKGPYQTKEGCLSLSGHRNCQRFKEIELAFFDQRLHRRQIHLTGLAAETVQHELDHLAGRLI